MRHQESGVNINTVVPCILNPTRHTPQAFNPAPKAVNDRIVLFWGAGWSALSPHSRGSWVQCEGKGLSLWSLHVLAASVLSSSFCISIKSGSTCLEVLILHRHSLGAQRLTLWAFKATSQLLSLI